MATIQGLRVNHRGETIRTTSETIRKNAVKRIESLLRSAVLVKEYRYDDMGDTNDVASVEEVMEHAKDFDRVYLWDNDVLHVVIHRNWTFTAYQNIQAARRHLTPQAFAKYFPGVA